MSDGEGELTLRVAKAIPSDVGHGRARVPFDNDLNLKPGDVIEINLVGAGVPAQEGNADLAAFEAL